MQFIQVILFGSVAAYLAHLGYARHTELRQLLGFRFALAAALVAAIASIPVTPRHHTVATLAQLADWAAILLAVCATILLFRQLARDKVIQTAYFDAETRLGNRGQWETWLRKYSPKGWVAVRVSFLQIKSVRKLPSFTNEKAFFDWFGQSLLRLENQPQGFIARLSVRDVGFLLEEQDPVQAVNQVLHTMQSLHTAIRSGGFDCRYVITAQAVDPVEQSSDDEPASETDT